MVVGWRGQAETCTWAVTEVTGCKVGHRVQTEQRGQSCVWGQVGVTA